MNPLQIFAISSLKNSPSLIEVETGVEEGIFIKKYLEVVRDEYEHVFLISFFDADKFLLTQIGELISKENIISVFGRHEDKSIEGSAPIITGYIGNFLKKVEGRTLAVVTGLCFYYTMVGEENLVGIYPRISGLDRYKADLDVLTVMNVEMFSEKVIGILRSFSYNILRLGIEERDDEFLRYAILLRSAFPEENLKKWYYKIEHDEVVFFNSKSGCGGLTQL
ncbi:hypothetical protein Asulf_01788 [Archaeoglobus sulfaticallidus PM70-1]|uniref:Uncharacterized protein n=1 Tax=Archaeoglobus sulfaticallidus PM70-1 TaxID=387631 RepID=N0BDP7_9EURY|nr:hypothetical protein [Archaeoglobus sulfaticallidus]AGK61759.1 hypothetical protein Asulf_01788 [Archaeoglobus sulfaticallidus PM70-1]